MNLDHWNRQIQNRVDEQVTDAIETFRNAVHVAVRDLCYPGESMVSVMRKDCARHVLDNLIAETDTKVTWPQQIWDKRREKLEKEIFMQLDVVARALRSQGGDPSIVPDEPVA